MTTRISFSSGFCSFHLKF